MFFNCAHRLDNGQLCGCPALQDGSYCRHHTPEALARKRRLRHPADPSPAASTNDPNSEPQQDTPYPPNLLRAYWRMHHRFLADADESLCDTAFEQIIGALAQHRISHRSAGRILQAVLDRQKVLAQQAQQAAIRAAEQQLRQRRADLAARRHPQSEGTSPASPQLSPETRSLLEALATTVIPTLAPEHANFRAPENYPVSR